MCRLNQWNHSHFVHEEEAMAENQEAKDHATETSAPVSFGRVLRNRQFFALWLANLVSNFGDWLALMGLFTLLAFRWKGTPSQVSGIMIAFVIPMALFGPIAGVFIDRWNIKRTMIASDVIRAILAALLALATMTSQIYLIVFAMSAVSAFFMPAQMVAIPRLVRREELLVANALNSQTMNFNRVIGPAAASALVGWAGEKICFYLDAITFVFSAGLLMLVVLPHAKNEAQAEKKHIVKELMEGLRFIISHRAILFLIGSMAAAILAIGAFDALVVIYVRDVLASQSQLFGAMISLVGVTTILGAGIIGKFGQHHSKLLLVVTGIMVIGVSIFILAAFSDVRVTLGCCLLLGLGVAGVLVPSQTLIQEETPSEILGRVSSTSMSLMTVAQLLSFLVAGRVADWIGIRNLYYLVAILLVLIGGWGIVYTRVNRDMAAKTAH
jgi:MFS family permease